MWGKTLRQAILIGYSLFSVFPVLFTVVASFKSTSSFFSTPYALPHHWLLTNYGQGWSQGNLGTAFLNSFLITVSSIVASTLMAAWAAFALSRFRFRGHTLIRVIFVAGMIVPGAVVIIPLFIVLHSLGLVGTTISIILPFSAITMPLAVLVLVNFFSTVPRQIAEAARVDGCTYGQTFWYVELPLLRPALVTVLILNGVWAWNHFFIPLILATRQSLETVPVAIVSFFGVYSTSWGLIFATVTLASIPAIVAYVFLSRQFIEGVSMGSVVG